MGLTKHFALLVVALFGAGCAANGARTSEEHAATTNSITAGAASQPGAISREPAELVFFDSRSFDSDLSSAMRANSDEIVVNVPAGFNLNKIPERVDRWLFSVKDSGGTVVAEPAQPPPFKTRGIVSAAIDVVVSVFTKLEEMRILAPSERYHATLLYRGDGTVNKVVFRHRDARSFALVTPEEFAREPQDRESIKLRGLEKGDRGSPDIVLVRPVALEQVRSPTDIELRFLPQDPSRIVLNSLRVLYGFFGVNITDRMMKHAKVTESGIIARAATLPEGSHQITVEIADSRHRVGRRTFEFVIKEASE